jgi:hypothetical protein
MDARKTVLACLMRFRFAVRLSLFLALLVLPADALGAPAVRTFSVSGRLVAPTGHPSTLSLACPPGAVALNGAVTRQGGGVVVRRSIPGMGSGDWSFRVAAEGSGSRAVSAVLRCVALRLPEGFTSAHLGVSSRNSSNIVLAPGETATVRRGCGSAWTATGYALDAGRRGAIRLATAIPGSHGWLFTLENTGSATARGGVAVRCLRSTATARRPDGATRDLRFGVSRPSFATTFDAGRSRRKASAACGAHRFSLAAGVSVDPAGPVEVLRASPAGRGGARWVFGEVREGEGYARYTVCLSTASRFH